MAVGRRRRLTPLWALALILACAQHTGHAQYSSSESSYKYYPDLTPIQPGSGGSPLDGVTIFPPMKTIPVIRALNPAHNGRVCSTWGNFHFKTFDGDIFQFPGLCNYVFSSNCRATYEDFNIQVRRSQGPNGTVPSRVVMKLDGMVLQLTKSSVLVNDHPVQLPFSRSGVLIEQNGMYLKVAARLGLVFMWNLDNSLLLELDDKYANQTCGLCGDFNGVPVFNEFFSNNIKLTPVEYGNLQKLDGPMEQCQDPAPVPLRNCTPGLAFCEGTLLGQPFSGCHALVDASSYIAACQQDVCLCADTDPTSCACPTLAEYSRQCVHAGGVPQEWRTSNLCPAQGCPFNMEHRECGLPCADTCSNLEHAQLCEDHCISGCFCPEGMVFDDINQSGCVPEAQCSCTYNGLSYPPGAVYSTDCTNCTCSGGRWNCQETPCPGTCSVLGGAHFSTFDEKQYTVHGDCSYVLAKPCDGGAFTVLAELRKCGLTDSETCLKSVTLSLSGGQTVIVVKASGEVFVNQIYTQLPISAANVTLFRPSTFFIIAQTNLGLQLDIQLVPTMQVFLRLAPTLQGLTCGLCGNFNNIQADDFRTISGVVEGTAAAFFNTWKTQASCPNVKNNFEDPCSLSVENEKYAQHWCSLLTDTEGPFASCHATVNPATYYSNCMFDTCNCEKSEDCLCASLSAYVRTCAIKGIQLQGWRDSVCAKPMMSCPKSLTYQDVVNTCQPTCRSLSEEDVTCHISFVPVDGCVCANGTFLDDLGKCVPVTSCPCYYRGSVVPNGESVHDSGTVCTCTKGKLTCIGDPAPVPVCVAPMVYFDCRNATPGAAGAGCQKSCHTLDMACYSPQCVSGCVCPDGLVSDGEGGCIAEADCPCVHNEASYKPGQTVHVGCNTCTCKNRMWQCTQEPCLATCAVYGDGHYLTFDGQRFTFEGDCEYTLVQDHCGSNGSSQGSFRVVTENIPCGTTGTTCSKAIKIFLGSYELKLSGGKVEVIEKGTGQAVPYSIRYMGIYLVVDTDVGLVLQWDKKTSLFLRLSPEFKGKVCGLCGNFDGNAINDFTTRSHLVVSDVLEFGNSWKFSPSCPDALAPRDPCTANPYRKSWAQKQCSILHSATFATCHAHVEPTKYYEACVSDACACDSGGDCECFCTAVAAYAQACQDAGVCVSWRSPEVCPLFCDYYNPNGECEWHYQPCGAPCMQTCRNPSGHCLHDVHGLEGCYPKCPPETPIFDEDEMQCVAQCSTPPPPPPCRVRGKDYRPGAVVPSSENCHTCVCTESGVKCAYDADACVCTYGGQQFHPGDVIYHTADGTGSCITARCVANGTIERGIYSCDTSTAPTTTFSFSTTSNVESSPKTTVSIFTSKTLSTPVSTSPNSTMVPNCGELCQWTPWLDVSHPGQGVDSGDFDTLQNLREHGFRVCQTPKEVKCRAENMPDVPLEMLGQHVECSRTVGLTCYNKDQASGLCYNYQIKIMCCSPLLCPPLSSSSAPTSTSATSRTTHTTATPVTPSGRMPTNLSTTPTTTPLPGSSTSAPGTHTPAPSTHTSAAGSSTHTPATSTHATGSHTTVPGSSTPAPDTHTPYPVSSTHITGTHTPLSSIHTSVPGSSTHASGTYTSAPGTHTPAPASSITAPASSTPAPASSITAPASSTPAPASSITAPASSTPTPASSTTITTCSSTSTPAPETTTDTTASTTPTTVCKEERCTWTQWLDGSYPQSDRNSGDFDTFHDLRAKGYDICEHPKDVECRAERYPDTPLALLGQNVICSKTEGLLCLNKDQLPPICYNYEIRILCCKIVDICKNVTHSTPSTVVSPTVPTTTETSILTTTPTSQPTTTSVTYPVSTTTATTPTTRSSPTSIATKTTSTTLTSVTATSSTIVSPTTSQTPVLTTNCSKQCTWTKWFDVDFPSSGPHGGDVETYDNIIRHGEKVCHKPQDITQLECRAENHPEVSIKQLGQVVECNPDVGLVCRNQDQVGKFKMCLNYEIRVLCCEHICSATVPTPTSSPSTVTGTSSTETTTTVSTTSSPVPRIVSPMSTRSTAEKTPATTSSTITPTKTTIHSTTHISSITSTTGSSTMSSSHPSSVPTATSTPLTTTPATSVSVTSTPVSTVTSTSVPETTHSQTGTTTCSKQCTWTKWFDVDFPSSGPHGGDVETYDNIIRHGEKVCHKPQDITQLECRAENHPEVSIKQLGQVVECNRDVGLVCRNQDQVGKFKMCLNYEIRVLCCERVCSTTVPTPISSPSTVTGTSSPESTTTVSTTSSPVATSHSPMPTATTSSSTPATTSSTITPTKTTIHSTTHISSITSTTGSSTMSSSHPSSVPTATSTPLTTTPATSMSVTSTPVSTVTSTSVPETTHSQTGTTTCSKQCTWTKWFDVDFPSSGPHGGDVETYDNIIRHGEKVCHKPQDITQLECRAENHPEVSIKQLGQVVECNRDVGLVCRNQDQVGKFKMCLNYEIRVLCCQRVCSTTVPTPTSSPSTVTSTSSTESTTTVSTTSSPVATSHSPMPTATTSSSTPATTSSTITPTKTTIHSTTHISSITSTTGSSTMSSSLPSSVPTATSTPLTTTLATSVSVTSTPVSTVTSTSVPETTHSQTGTTTCSKQCTWTKWFDVDFPSSGPHGGDVETYENIIRHGEKVCHKPQDITQLECRAENYPEVSIKQLGQVVECNRDVGLVCHNQDQVGKFKMCLNYEIRVLCCQRVCSMTVPTPTSSPSTVTGTSSPESTTTVSTTSSPVSGNLSSTPTSTTASTTLTSLPATTSTTVPPPTTTAPPTTSITVPPAKSTPTPPVPTTTTPATTSTTIPIPKTTVPTRPPTPIPATSSTIFSSTKTTTLTPSVPMTTPTPLPTTTSTTIPTPTTTIPTSTTTIPTPTTTIPTPTTTIPTSTTTIPTSTTTIPTPTTTIPTTTSTITPLTISTTVPPTQTTTPTPPAPMTTLTSLSATTSATGPQTQSTAGSSTSIPVTTTKKTSVSDVITSVPPSTSSFVSETSYSQPITVTCPKQCTWTKWFDVDFPSSGPHGGDVETYDNIIRHGEKVCHKPQDITQLECRAENHPEVSIKQLGQVVECNRDVGLVCRNQDQVGKFKMCLNYEIRVLCCERICSATVPTPTSSPSTVTGTSSTESTTTVSTTSSPVPRIVSPMSTKSTAGKTPTTTSSTITSTKTTIHSTTHISSITSTTGSSTMSSSHPSSVPTATSTPLTTTPATSVSVTSTPVSTVTSTSVPETTHSQTGTTTCSKQCTWTKWFDVDFPSSGPHGGDVETYDNIIRHGEKVCHKPQDITQLECRAENYPEVSIKQLGQVLECNRDVGLVCRNQDQVGKFKMCLNYEIRVLCCERICSATVPTPTSSPSTVTGTSSTETTTTVSTTSNPVPRIVSPMSTKSTAGKTATTTSSIITSTKTTIHSTTHISSITSTTGSSTMSSSHPSSVPTATSTPLTTTPATSVSVTSTPASTVTSTSVPETTHSQTGTTTCSKQCTWTKWFDVDFPSSGPHGGDVETYDNIIRHGEKVCHKPQDITQLECRAENHPEVSIKQLGQVVECNRDVGLVCRNQDQVGKFKMCLNYEIRVLCCQRVCSTTVPTPTSSPSTVTGTSSTESTTTVSTTSSPVATSHSPMPTATTSSSTPATTSSTITPTKTTIHSTTHISSITSTTGSSSMPTGPLSSVPTATSTPLTTTPATSVSVTSTPTVTSTSVPETTHSQTGTTTCSKQCTWTKWFDVDFPSSGPHGGDVETYDNIIRHGEKVCHKPQDITQLECRAENYPEVSIKQLGQVVECNRDVGLVCRNQDQVGKFKMCLNYEIRVLCCQRVCSTTVPTPTSSPSTVTGTSSTESTTTVSTTSSPVSGNLSSTPTSTTASTTLTSLPATTSTTVPPPTTTAPPTTSITVPPAKSTPTPPVPTTTTPATTSTTIPTPTTTIPTPTTTIPTTTSTITPLTISTTVPPTQTTTPTPPALMTTLTSLSATPSATGPQTQSTAGSSTSIPVTTTKKTSVSDVTTSVPPSTSSFVSETSYSQPITVTCPKQCTWTKWFDVDFPSSGPHGGDVETYDNIIRHGEKVCHKPQDITQLECRAENHPEVSIKLLGQVVECNPDVGLVCRNQDQADKMCFNYEIRVLCCDHHDGCPSTSISPSVTYPTLPTSSPESKSVITPTPPNRTTGPCYCIVLDKLYPAGSTIYQETDLDGHCYSAYCTQDCQVVRHDSHDCSSTPQTPPTPAPTTVLSSSHSPDHRCSDVIPPRKKGETWNMPNCTQATCEGHNVITLHPRKCPPTKALTCANGYPAVKVVDEDGCCPHDECQCVCSGWGDPHYITFDGTYYTFLDNCTYVLMQQIVPRYGHLRVLIDNYFCNAEDGLSCPRSIIIEYQQDRIVMTRKPGGVGIAANQVFFNGKEVQPGFRSNGIVVSQLGIKMYVSIPGIGLQVMFTGLIFSVEVPFSKFTNNTEGQCGTCTNNQKDDCRLPDGAVVASCSEMSNHWRVTNPDQPSCHGPPPTPLPTTPTPTTTEPTPCPVAPVCQLVLSDVFKQCHKVIPPLPYYEGCVFDQCHVTDPDVMCSSLELYASLCASQGACIDWRGHTNHTCSFTCPANKVYQSCGPVSQTYCYGNNSASVLALQDTGSYMEGCFCPLGMTLFSESSDVCVPSNNCFWCLGPNGQPVEPGQTVIDNCQECVCDGNTQSLVCQPQPCPLPPSCYTPGHTLVPVPLQTGQCCAEYQCVCNASLCPQFSPCPNNSHSVSSHNDADCCPSQKCVLDVCVINGSVYKPGAVVSSSLCETCRCQATEDPEMDPYVICDIQICEHSCPLGSEYRVPEGQCCGFCVPVACVVNASDGSAHLFYPGETWSEPGNLCETHECEKYQDGLMVVTTRKSCPPLNCPKNKAKLSEDGCCLFCPTQQNQSTCAVHYKEEVIRERGCSSAQPVLLAYCRGNCGDTSSMYSFEANMVEHTCRCCQELRTSLRNVTLSCRDGSSRTLSYRFIEDCGCEGPKCPAQGNPGHSESWQSEEEKSQETRGSWVH